jgi:heme exporter protein C
MNKYFNPNLFSKIIDKLLMPIVIMFIITLSYGIYQALVISPADYQQGEMVRIMYIHVPAAWMSLFIYSFMAVFSTGYLVWKNPFADMLVRSAAPIGACFTLIALITGSIWGKPIWGTWWVWDARLTSTLILFFFYLAYISLDHGTIYKEQNANNLAILALIGFINVPIVKFSVNFWNSLHQPASIIRMKGPSIHSSMLKPLFVMAVACLLYFLMILALKLKTEILLKKTYRLEQNFLK